jgi:hypothetical protein
VDSSLQAGRQAGRHSDTPRQMLLVGTRGPGEAEALKTGQAITSRAALATQAVKERNSMP